VVMCASCTRSTCPNKPTVVPRDAYLRGSNPRCAGRIRPSNHCRGAMAPSVHCPGSGRFARRTPTRHVRPALPPPPPEHHRLPSLPRLPPTPRGPAGCLKCDATEPCQPPPSPGSGPDATDARGVHRHRSPPPAVAWVTGGKKLLVMRESRSIDSSGPPGLPVPFVHPNPNPNPKGRK